MNGAKHNIDERLDLIEEPKLHFSDLLEYLESSPLKGMSNINVLDIPPEGLSPKDIQNICKCFEQLLLEDLTYDKLTAMFVASSIIYLMSSNFQDFECRTELLHKTFRYTNTLVPVNLHIAAKRLHENLKSKTNLLFLCKNICFSSDIGNALAMCLVWAMLLEALDKEIDMYCFHPFAEINELLVNVNISEMLNSKETSMKAYFLLQLTAVLVSNIISRSNEVFKKAGYSEYFRYELEDIHALRDWARIINRRITVSVENPNTNYDLIMAIKETITFNIISPLDDKLKTIDGGRDHFGLVHSLC